VFIKENVLAGFVTYIKETVEELRHKVTWPTWSELQQSALLVLVASVIFSLIIFAMDYAFGNNVDSSWRGLLGQIYDWINGSSN
jgi:preprotein translocase subunit SecE